MDRDAMAADLASPLSAFAWALTPASCCRFAALAPPWPSTARSPPSPVGLALERPATGSAITTSRQSRTHGPGYHRQPDPLGRSRPRAAWHGYHVFSRR